MKKTITIYELLGLIKDGKQPKYISINRARLFWDGKTYQFETEYCTLNWDYYIEDNQLNTFVEILDEEETYSFKFKKDEKGCFTDANGNKFLLIPVNEEEFEDIEENNDILRFDDLQCPYGANEEKFIKYIIIFQKQINQLIKNQKILIEKTKENK